MILPRPDRGLGISEIIWAKCEVKYVSHLNREGVKMSSGPTDFFQQNALSRKYIGLALKQARKLQDAQAEKLTSLQAKN